MALFVWPVAMAMALIVSEALTVIGPVNGVDEAVGVEPSVV